jgi:hypothetical protein
MSLILFTWELTIIAALLFACSPAAVSQFIVSVRVGEAIKRFPLGANSHVCKEVFKGVLPSLTDLYSSTTITVIRLMAWLIAAIFHGEPCVVSRGAFSISLVPMRSVKNRSNISGKASAALGASISQLVAQNELGISAITLARPFGISERTQAKKTHNYVTPKSLPSEFHLRPALSHEGALQ